MSNVRRMWLVISSVAFATVVPGSVWAQTPAETKNQRITMDALNIDQLFNSNTQPEFVRIRGFLRPKFAGDYDFTEDRRIRSLFFKLAREESANLWGTLMENTNDERYALVIGDNGSDAEIWTVGRICRYICESRLSLFDRVNSDVASADRPDVYIGSNESMDDLKKWWEDNGKPGLKKIQLKHCKENLHRLLESDEISATAKEYYREKISDTIEQIEKTKEPVYRKIGWDRFDWFIPKPESPAENVRTK